MIRYAAGRLAVTVPILLAVSFATFWAAGEISSPTAQLTLNPRISPEARRAYFESLGLDEPFGVRYLTWLGNFVTGDLGTSLVLHRPSEIVVAVSLAVAGAILAESTLSYLGLGVSASRTATWGNMLGGNEGFVITAPWLVWAPGLAIVVTVLCINFIGDGLRDALDPPRR